MHNEELIPRFVGLLLGGPGFSLTLDAQRLLSGHYLQLFFHGRSL